MLIPESLKSRAIDLTAIGCNELAWVKDDALNLLETLHQDSKIVLGGDVLKPTEGGWQHNYDNWHFEPSPTQSQELNCAASISTAKQYILDYPKGEYVFVLVTA